MRNNGYNDDIGYEAQQRDQSLSILSTRDNYSRDQNQQSNGQVAVNLYTGDSDDSSYAG